MQARKTEYQSEPYKMPWPYASLYNYVLSNDLKVAYRTMPDKLVVFSEYYWHVIVLIEAHNYLVCLLSFVCVYKLHTYRSFITSYNTESKIQKA